MELQKRRADKLPLDDESIIALYWTRDEKAIEETDFKYKAYLFSIAYRVLRDKQDAEECLNDTYLGAWGGNASDKTKRAQSIFDHDCAPNCHQALSQPPSQAYRSVRDDGITVRA